MMHTELYDLAYAFRKTKIWKHVYGEDLFAIRLGDEIGYCCILGNGGMCTALTVYVGAAGFSSFRDMLDRDHNGADGYMLQDCIQCSLEGRDQFTKEELEEVKAYCAAAGINFRAPLPKFLRFYPGCLPWRVPENELEIIRTALQVVLELAPQVEMQGRKALGLRSVMADREQEYYMEGQRGSARRHQPGVTIPLYTLTDDGLLTERIPLPPYQERKLQPPQWINDITLAKLKKQPKGGSYACDITYMPAPVDGNPPFFPAVLITLDQASGMMLAPVMASKAPYDPDEMLNGFMNALLNIGICPQQIMVRSEETQVLLKDFCKRAGILLTMTDDMPDMDEAIDGMTRFFSGEEDAMDDESDGMSLAEFIDAMMALPEEKLADMPDELLMQLRMLEAKGMLPEALVRKLPKR